MRKISMVSSRWQYVGHAQRSICAGHTSNFQIHGKFIWAPKIISPDLCVELVDLHAPPIQILNYVWFILNRTDAALIIQVT
jgi:hypothetical protein